MALDKTTAVLWNLCHTMLPDVGEHSQSRGDEPTFTSSFPQVKRVLLLRCIDD